MPDESRASRAGLGTVDYLVLSRCDRRATGLSVAATPGAQRDRDRDGFVAAVTEQAGQVEQPDLSPATPASASSLSGVCVSAVPLAKGEPAVFTVSAGGTYTLADVLPGQYRVEFQAGCGQGVKTQWWQDAASSAAAKIITVSAGATVSGIDAVMTGG